MRAVTVLLSFTLLCLGCGREPDGTPTQTGDVPPVSSAQPRQPAQPEEPGGPGEAMAEKDDAAEAPHAMPHGMGHAVEDQLAGLRKDLEEKEPEARVKILEEIWGAGKRAKWTVPVLEELMNDEEEDARIRYRAVFALLAMEKIDPDAEQVMPALLEALKDESPVVRREAVKALGPKGLVVQPQLEQVLENDEEGSVRATAAGALGSTGSAALPALLKALESDEDENVRASAAGALSRMGPDAKPAMPALVKALRDKKKNVRSAAARALGQMGTEAIADLKEALNSENAGAQSVAAGTLGRIGTDGLPALLEALESGNMFAKFVAASVLGSMGTEAKDAIPALQKLLEDKDPSVRTAAAGALRKIKEAAD